uniref:NADH-ubiquinone oxidoreductase chain 4 n=1 Tax=Trigonopterus selaruensis TaxID=2678945 RepID=A0A7H1KHQ9_9CUCU|nr:NADH dehydrogenase subunit 4 [Trigonopterus selaruensis]QNT26825.1 NADH dehydrogenase subunit 4 [Trigonopterus selaruensis]
MMGLVFSVLFLIPLIFYCLSFWFVLVILFLVVFKFLLMFSFSLVFSNLSYWFGMDVLSYFMVLLSLWICCLMVLASEDLYKCGFYSELFLFMIVVLVLSLILTFSSLNLFIFYVFFEVSLVPTLFLILGWGFQPERIMAGVYLLFYTLLASLPMMVALFYLNSIFSTLELCFLSSVSSSLILFFCVNMVFFVKIPMFLVHLWLPKAHVEAPVSGSMILAGVMLKLGGYGLMRVMKMFVCLGMSVSVLIVTVSLVGGLVISLICIRQSDFKIMIAYSSISHMGMVSSGIFTLNSWGYWGALVLMFAHGLCSSGLFCLVNLFYERTGSRSIYLNKGLINIMPSISLWAFMLCSSNMAAPPSLNLLGEILLINSLLVYSKWVGWLLFFLIFFSAVYSLFLYSYTQHGQLSSSLYSFFEVSVREYLLLFLHWVPLNFMFLSIDSLVLMI